jgi:hypothetical protein
MAYTYARGYYDGRAYGNCESPVEWMTDAEKHAYNMGYDRGVMDYHSYDESKSAA